MDRGKTGVAGPGSVAASGLKVVEEVQHDGGVEIGQLKRGGRFAGALLEEAEQQLERVAIAFHGACAGTTLGDQTPQEEVLHELGEPDLRGPHDTPCGEWPTKASKRVATMSISSGTAERYQ